MKKQTVSVVKRLMALMMALALLCGAALAEEAAENGEIVLENPDANEIVLENPDVNEIVLENPGANEIVLEYPDETPAQEDSAAAPEETPAVSLADGSTLPEDAKKVFTLEDALNPDRFIDVYAVYDGEFFRAGMRVTLVAVFNGYDNLTYTFCWQRSDGGAWYSVGGQNDPYYSFTMDESAYNADWRVLVEITAGIVEK